MHNKSNTGLSRDEIEAKVVARRKEVAKYQRQGLTYREIGEKVDASENTVKSDIAALRNAGIIQRTGQMPPRSKELRLQAFQPSKPAAERPAPRRPSVPPIPAPSIREIVMLEFEMSKARQRGDHDRANMLLRQVEYGRTLRNAVRFAVPA